MLIIAFCVYLQGIALVAYHQLCSVLVIMAFKEQGVIPLVYLDADRVGYGVWNFEVKFSGRTAGDEIYGPFRRDICHTLLNAVEIEGFKAVGEYSDVYLCVPLFFTCLVLLQGI